MSSLFLRNRYQLSQILRVEALRNPPCGSKPVMCTVGGVVWRDSRGNPNFDLMTAQGGGWHTIQPSFNTFATPRGHSALPTLLFASEFDCKCWIKHNYASGHKATILEHWSDGGRKNDFSFMYICLVNHCSLDAEWSIAAKEINITVCLLRKWCKRTGGGLHILGGKPRQLETLSVLLFQPSWAHSYFILLFSLLILSQTCVFIFWQSQLRHPDVLRLKQF